MPEQPTKSERVSDFVITTIVFTIINYFLRNNDFARSLLVAALAALFFYFLQAKN